jgi:hypothetical protein
LKVKKPEYTTGFASAPKILRKGLGLPDLIVLVFLVFTAAVLVFTPAIFWLPQA